MRTEFTNQIVCTPAAWESDDDRHSCAMDILQGFTRAIGREGYEWRNLLR